jgi:NADP-dependent 3-hydroxy acid dehydrogenase YdfG
MTGPSLENRVMVVTRAARGIGESTARKLAQEGARLALWDRGEARLERTEASLKGVTDVEVIL